MRGTSLIVSSEPAARTFVCFFSRTAFTSRSSWRAFSPITIPSYTSSPGPDEELPALLQLHQRERPVRPRRSATSDPEGRVRISPCQGS